MFISYTYTLFLLGLVLDSLNTSTNGILVTQIASLKRGNGTGLWNWSKIVVKLINERCSCRNVELGNGALTNAIQMFDQGSEGVSVSSNQNSLSVFDKWSNLVFKVWNDAVQSGGQGFREILVKLKTGITWVARRVVLTGSVDSWRRDIVGSSPDEDLVLSVLVYSFLLIESLERTVVTLVKFPGLGCRDPHQLSLLKNVPKSTNGSLKEGSKGDVRNDSFGFDELSSLNDFLGTLRGERTVIPTSELVFKVPCRFTVSHKDQSVLIGSLNGSKAVNVVEV